MQSRRDFPTNPRKRIYYDDPEKYIVSHDLLLYSSAKHRLRAKTWKFEFWVRRVEDIPPTYLNHIDVDTSLLSQVLKQHATRDWTYDVYPTYHKLSFDKYDNNYRIYFASSVNKVLEVHPKKLKELAPGVYWH